MKTDSAKIVMIILIFVGILWPFNASAQSRVDCPWVPRASVYEVWAKYKAGKAIIVHAGGGKYEARHIVGSLNIPERDISSGKMKAPKLPKKGIEIFTYCY